MKITYENEVYNLDFSQADPIDECENDFECDVVRFSKSYAFHFMCDGVERITIAKRDKDISNLLTLCKAMFKDVEQEPVIFEEKRVLKRGFLNFLLSLFGHGKYVTTEATIKGDLVSMRLIQTHAQLSLLHAE